MVIPTNYETLNMLLIFENPKFSIMRTALLLIMLVHGIIHLLGFLKAFFSVSNYKNFNGHNLGSFGEAIWHYPDGKFTYGKFSLKDIKYNMAD